MTTQVTLINGLIVVVVPILIYLTRIYLPRIPKNFYPLLAPAIGAVLEILVYQAGAVSSGNPLLGAALGGLGVWLREVVDQLKRPIEPPVTPP